MALVHVMTHAKKDPKTGKILRKYQIFEEVPDNEVNAETGLTDTQEKSFDELAKAVAREYKKYLDTCKNRKNKQRRRLYDDVSTTT